MANFLDDSGLEKYDGKLKNYVNRRFDALGSASELNFSEDAADITDADSVQAATAYTVPTDWAIHNYVDFTVPELMAENVAGTAKNLDGVFEREFNVTYNPTAGVFDVTNAQQALIQSIRGRTVSWNQLVVNGDFSDGKTGWSSSSFDLVATDGAITITSQSTVNISSALVGNVAGSIVGHIYFGTASVRFNDALPTAYVFYGVGGYYGVSIAPNKFALGQWTTISGIYSVPGASGSDKVSLYPRQPAGVTGNSVSVKNAMLIDLTLIYGAGNEPSTPEAFEADYEAWFGHPLTYEAYTAGELRNLTATGIKTVGFNLLASDGTAHVLKDKQYQITGTYTSLTLNDKSITALEGIFTPTESGTLRVSGGAADTCVHFVHSGRRNGEFEEHWESTKNLPITTMTGKLLVNGQPSGESVVLAPHGILQAGSVKDEIRIENGKRYYYKYVGDVDLGMQTWTKRSGGDGVFQVDDPGVYRRSTLTQAICSRYKYGGTITGGNQMFYEADKTFFFYYNSASTSRLLYVKDLSYTTAADFKAAMSGVMLNYELATPEVYLLDEEYQEDDAWSYKADDWGTEELVSGTTQSAPMNANIEYGINALDTLRNLPMNYVSATIEQSFSDRQKQQARENIGAASEELESRVTAIENIINDDSGSDGDNLVSPFIIPKDALEESGGFVVDATSGLSTLSNILAGKQFYRLVLQTEADGEVTSEQCGVASGYVRGENYMYVYFHTTSESNVSKIKLTTGQDSIVIELG